jgi:spermidine dehydrogenase
VKAILPDAITGSRSFADVLFAPINFDALDRPQHTRVRLGATAVAVRHDGEPENSKSVNVTYAVNGELKCVRGQAAIVATGGWIPRHIGHSELSGRQSWGRAAQESRRALNQVLEVIA